MSIKYCEDCKHRAPTQIGVFSAHCQNPKLAGPVALVSKTLNSHALPRCVVLRADNSKCREAGEYFEPRAKVPHAWWRIWA
jgi:hypothetical protein